MKPGYLSVSAALCAAALSPAALSAQLRGQPAGGGFAEARVRVTGRVIARGVPMPEVNVFDAATLEGGVTDVDGRFVMQVKVGPLRLMARRVGFRLIDTTITVGVEGETVTLTLIPFTALRAIAVQAGEYSASAERTATLTPLEVATTPGANADITGAIKTLPGVQNTDEGTGLFVRGGDLTETRTVIDGAPLYSAVQFEAPTGSVAQTVNPFLVERITFSAGGFGAAYGNALSALVDLRTQGLAPRTSTTANASIGGVSLAGTARLRGQRSITATAAYSNLAALFRVFGNTRDFEPPPIGTTVSTQAVQAYGDAGVLKLFALRQTAQSGVRVQEPVVSSIFASERASHIVVLSWEDRIGSLHLTSSAASSSLAREESFGAYAQDNTLRTWYARHDADWTIADRLRLRAGVDGEHTTADFVGRFPVAPAVRDSDAATTRSALVRGERRLGAYLESQLQPLSDLRLSLGARVDHSGWGGRTTVDPRVSVAYRPRTAATFMAAWGRYHQDADPAYIARSSARMIAPLSAEQSMVGAQFGESRRMLRAELWAKRYIALVQLDRAFNTVTAGTGRARGIDLFARTTGRGGLSYRLTYSGATSRRTDANTGVMARAPFDVTHSITAVIDRAWGEGWRAGVAYRHATGRPFTNIVSAVRQPDSSYVPAYGTPYAERLPEHHRVDATISRARPLTPQLFGVWFVSFNNVLGRRNVFAYRWSADYASRIAVPSVFNRTVFVGANLTVSARR